MNTFISHSGTRSRATAEELERFVRLLVPGSNPWISPTGIEKGTRWGTELAKNLGTASAGIVCLTPENLREEWILFEAGALSREPTDRVWTFLLDIVDDTQLPAPLAQFQNTKAAVKADVLLMIRSMNRVVSTEPRREDDLLFLFETLWSAFEIRIGEIRAMPHGQVAPRPNTEIMADVLATVREMTRQSSKDSWRVQKSLAMLHDIYRAVTGSKSPTLREFAERGGQEPSIQGLYAAIEERFRMGDSTAAGMSWQPQYGGTPLPARPEPQGPTTSPPPDPPERPTASPPPDPEDPEKQT